MQLLITHIHFAVIDAIAIAEDELQEVLRGHRVHLEEHGVVLHEDKGGWGGSHNEGGALQHLVLMSLNIKLSHTAFGMWKTQVQAQI
jgi:hypothetical protein